ncbi:MAG TPA: ABC transporter substrate-binding protein, partial [Paracoccaceae bacterium]|nr:ABC transporter substrate-binding protein [Paracoccaceae bacterium]
LPYEVTDPTVASQVISAKASGATVFFNVATNKFAAQAIRKAHEIGWNPVHFLNSVAHSTSAVMRPAGLEAAQGVITAGYQMDQSDPRWRDHPEFREWQAFMDEYYPEGDRSSNLTGYAYGACMALKTVLEQAGDDLSRENIMTQAANLDEVRVPMLLPGITADTSPTDYFPIESMRLQRFEGEGWKPFGELISTESE